MRIQDHFSISVNLDVGCGHRRVSVTASAQVYVPLGHCSLIVFVLQVYFCREIFSEYFCAGLEEEF